MKTIRIVGSNKEYNDEITMVSELMRYCKTHRRNNAVNLSRDFQAEDNFGTLYIITVKFDRDENLINVHIDRRKKSASAPVVFPYSVMSTWHMQNFMSREEMLTFVKLHPSERFELTASKGGKVTKYHIFYEDGAYFVDGKRYAR